MKNGRFRRLVFEIVLQFQFEVDTGAAPASAKGSGF
jgi:hypothetical protein